MDLSKYRVKLVPVEQIEEKAQIKRIAKYSIKQLQRELRAKGIDSKTKLLIETFLKLKMNPGEIK